MYRIKFWQIRNPNEKRQLTPFGVGLYKKVGKKCFIE
jgi:hypothetical protein